MMFEFAMMDDKAKVVDCEIGSTAMDELAGIRGTAPAEKEAQFLHLLDRIERIASDLFDNADIRREGPRLPPSCSTTRSVLRSRRPTSL
jgi:hypothetical protein